jgi:hypothetical protein
MPALDILRLACVVHVESCLPSRDQLRLREASLSLRSRIDLGTGQLYRQAVKAVTLPLTNEEDRFILSASPGSISAFETRPIAFETRPVAFETRPVADDVTSKKTSLRLAFCMRVLRS